MNVFSGMFVDGSIEELAKSYLTRNQDKSFSCSVCGKVSRDLYNAKRHLEDKHFRPDSGYKCQFCGAVCVTLNALSKHMSRQHRNKWLLCTLFLLSYLFIGWQRGLEEQFSQYITKNPDRSCTCALCGKVSRDLYNAKRHLMKCFKTTWRDKRLNKLFWFTNDL